MLNIRIIGKWSHAETEDIEKVEEIYSFAFDRFLYAIRDVNITFSDLNGPRGGIDTQCLIRIILRSGSQVIAKAKGRDILDSAQRACSKSSKSISKSLQRSRNNHNNLSIRNQELTAMN